jgi:hypothetical protein
MNPDNLQRAWRSQSSPGRLTINAELLLKEVHRNHRFFGAIVFWRDVREVGVALLLVPAWIYLGTTFVLPWTWYLTVPAMIWVASFMLVDRMRHKRQSPEASDPLFQHVENSLAQVEHQIWLLRNVFWWYLLPLALSVAAFFAQISWEVRGGGWLAALVAVLAALAGGAAFAWVYRLNQDAVRSELIPRREELELLLSSLKEEASVARQ